MRSSSPESPELSEVLDRLSQLEQRLAQLEARLGSRPAESLVPAGVSRDAVVESTGEPSTETPGAGVEVGAGAGAGESLEFQLGQNLFAKVGIVILGLGMAFLLSLPYPGVPSFLPSLAGYLLVAGLAMAGRALNRGYPQISRYLLGGALFLLYLATIRLSFFGAAPALTHRGGLSGLLMAVLALNLIVSVRRRSQALAGMQMILGCATALVAGAPMPVFAILLLVSGIALGLARRQGWDGVALGATVLVPLTHGVWALGNPLLGGTLRVVDGPEANLLFLLLYAAVFAVGGAVGRQAMGERPIDRVGAFLNAGITYLLLGFLTLTAFKDHVLAWNLVASGFFLAFAVVHWVARRSQVATFAYAMTGYTALSAAVIGGVALPEGWLWLCWESLLVVSTAVWFRSRFIVVANFGIFLGLFAAFLLTARTVGPVSLSFGVVALATARVLNWQKDRLELKTEVMRNAYLATALFVIPYAL